MNGELEVIARFPEGDVTSGFFTNLANASFFAFLPEASEQRYSL
jgi:hypothetical protein